MEALLGEAGKYIWSGITFLMQHCMSLILVFGVPPFIVFLRLEWRKIINAFRDPPA